jgi:signal transduction histidine kinase
MADAGSELVLILAPVGRDAAAAEQQLRAAGLATAVCTGITDLVARLRMGAGVAIVAEEALAGEPPEPLREWLVEQLPWSDFPLLILTSQQASRRVDAHRLHLLEAFGNVSLLERPLSAVSLLSAVKAALRARRRQYEVRDHLIAREEAAKNLEKLVQNRTRQLLDTNKRLRAEMAERKQAETALQQAQKMEAVGQMTGGIAHDFNNLLTAVIGNLDLARRRVQDEKIGRWLSSALQAAQRGAKLTGQLLAFARKQHLQVEPTDLNALISGIGDLLVRTIGGTVRIETSLQPGLWPVLIDASQVELIILNLALNARDAMPEGGLLRVGTTNIGLDDANRPQRLHLTGDFVCLSVSDTGTGMSRRFRPRRSSPFLPPRPLEPGPAWVSAKFTASRASSAATSTSRAASAKAPPSASIFRAVVRSQAGKSPGMRPSTSPTRALPPYWLSTMTLMCAPLLSPAWRASAMRFLLPTAAKLLSLCWLAPTAST